MAGKALTISEIPLQCDTQRATVVSLSKLAKTLNTLRKPLTIGAATATTEVEAIAKWNGANRGNQEFAKSALAS